MNKNLSLTHLIREPRARAGGPAAAAPLLLLLHGIGSNEADLLGLAPYLDERFFIVSARAPVVMGPGAYGWFNIEFTPAGLVADMAEARSSLTLAAKFIDELTHAYQLDARRVYLMGFSQGAMMSLALAMARAGKTAGVVAMSGRLPAPEFQPADESDALAGLPVLVTHGLYDPVLPISNGRDIRDRVAALGASLTYREYPMGHEVSNESLREVARWLTETLTAAEDLKPSRD